MLDKRNVSHAHDRRLPEVLVRILSGTDAVDDDELLVATVGADWNEETTADGELQAKRKREGLGGSADTVRGGGGGRGRGGRERGEKGEGG